jgi:glycine/D-amino acid oxidase-like deaminating enzyme
MPAWRALAEQAQLSDLLRTEGCMYFYREKMPSKSGEWGLVCETNWGVRQEWLTRAEVAILEPGLPPTAGGLYFKDAAHIVDPAVLTSRLAAAAQSNGASFQRARVQRLEPLNRGQIRLACDDRIVEARFVVIAAGAWSRPLARQVGGNILSIRNAATMSNLPWTLFRSGGPSARLILAFISRRWKVVCGSRDRSSLAGSPRR